MIVADYHTHTTYSHGSGSVLDSALVAKEKGLKEIAITDHGFNHMAYGIKRKEVPSLKKDIIEATEKTGMKIYLGVEANICGYDGNVDIVPEDYENLEWLVVGFHNFVKASVFEWMIFVFGNIIASSLHIVSKKRREKNTQAYIKALRKYPIDVISHLNYICKVDCYEVAKVCAETNTYIELNGKRVHFTKEEIQEMLKTDVKFLINSDAHKPDKVGDGGFGDYMAKEYNIPKERIVNLTETVKPKEKR